ncbi:unnamed protein product [Dibothriocephalus latus]|uniref:Reverse transcriptase domain-containing protein n=1 Tax=Dibothriocephalus latus TaxID=60516 RepID=A0A3P7L0K3_DIBLA|nr:unnamed protein product [Dibothriocephalus latus]
MLQLSDQMDILKIRQRVPLGDNKRVVNVTVPKYRALLCEGNLFQLLQEQFCYYDEMEPTKSKEIEIATTIFATDEDTKEGQLVVLFFLHRKLDVREDAVETFLEREQLLKFCLRTCFTFDGKIYKQVNGTPMCSPISGLIAEAVLQRLESLVSQHHRPKFWERYVDDTFVVIERAQVLTFAVCTHHVP